MFFILKQPARLVRFLDLLLPKNQSLINAVRPYSYFINYSSRVRLCSAGLNNDSLVRNDQSVLIVSRSKHTGKKKKQRKVQDEESSDEEDEMEDADDESDELAGKGDDVKVFTVKSLRIDAFLKTALRVSRKTVESHFYDDRIRVNGVKIHKKSQNIRENDVIDVIMKVAPDPKCLIVDQVKILKIKQDPDTEMALVKAQAKKSVQVENYRGSNTWRHQDKSEDSL